LAETDIRSLLAVPVEFRGRSQGIVYLDSRVADGVFRRKDRDFLQLVADDLLLLLKHARVTDLEQRITEAEERSAALLEHATRAVEIGVATMAPDQSLARVSPTVHTMVEAWPTTSVWWERVVEGADWPEPTTCEICGEPEYVGDVRADLVTPLEEDGGGGRRRVFEITSTGHGHELTDSPGEHVLLVRNITEQFETNEQLKRMNRQLKEARDQAMAASEAKSQFLARMSHEFRTPLNAVIGYTDLLLEEGENLEAAQLERDLSNIRSSARQLLRLISDVLDVTKIESGRLEFEAEKVDIEPMLEEVTSTIQPLMEKADNELVVEAEPLELVTDETKLRQILLNLLKNAAKFTDDGTVTLRVETPEEGRARFDVSDTGIGMTEEEQEQIFDAFFQADQSSTSEFRGTGLGLTIVDRFAERMGGELSVGSTPGEGTTFRVEIASDLEAVEAADADAAVAE
jgi:signal transduction histidine kinase